MKLKDIVTEDGRIVPGVNTTVDVKPGETERQAAKLFPMNKGGKPTPLGVKGATPNQAFNLGLTESTDDIVARAEQFAQEAHKDHKRKYTGEPYYVHLDEVRNIVKAAGGSLEMQAAALLHDTVEDTATTPNDIAKAFGPVVARLVVELTDVSKPEDGNRATRKAMDRDKLAKASSEAQTIKYADLISNGKDIMQNDPKFAKVYMKEKAELLRVMKRGNGRLRDAALAMLPDDYKVTENISHTSKRLRDIERKRKVKIGSQEWFKLWFSLPYLKEDIETKPHVYLDMDGVQADFFSQWAKWHEKTTGKPTATWRDIEDPGQSIKDMSAQGPQFIEKFFADLPVLPGFKLILDWLQKNNIKYTILSAPIGGQPDASIKGKKSWLAKHNPGAEQEIFTNDKAQYATTNNKANVLIDDHGKYIQNWQNSGGIAIKHTDKNPQRTIDALNKVFGISEDSPYSWAKRKLGHVAHAEQYVKAAQFLHKILTRKYQETNGKLRHSLSYYAAMLTRQTGDKLNWRELEQEYLDMFGNELFEFTVNEAFVEPQFDREWEEAERYPEFVKIGKEAWIKLVSKGKAVTIKSAKGINNTDAADPDSFKLLDPAKQKRALAQLEKGSVEMPIVAVYSDGWKELIGGNTRLTAMMARDGKATVWVFKVPDSILENFADGKVKGKSRPGRVKRAGASCKGSVSELRRKAKKYSGERGKMYHWCANMKAGKK